MSDDYEPLVSGDEEDWGAPPSSKEFFQLSDDWPEV